MLCNSVLIVEDNNDIREIVEEVLRNEGYQAFGVCNGREALRALKEIPAPALILLDMMMPLMNGWEFLEAQKQDAKFANLPVVVISALDATAALVPEVSSVNGGDTQVVSAMGYIRKPLDLETLFDIVKIYCGPNSEETISSLPAECSPLN